MRNDHTDRPLHPRSLKEQLARVARSPEMLTHLAHLHWEKWKAVVEPLPCDAPGSLNITPFA
jgi:hypothetical protein